MVLDGRHVEDGENKDGAVGTLEMKRACPKKL